MKEMILTKKQIDELRLKTKQELLKVLYSIEDQTGYKSHKISRTIDYLQHEVEADICYEIYQDIYLDSFYGNHDETDTPVSFDEFYNNEWQDEDVKDWYMSIYEQRKQGE